MKRMVRRLPAVLLLLMLPAVQACATEFTLSSPAIDGRVIDEKTNQPLADALVVVRWQGHVGWSGTICFHVETATTDKSGRYRIPAWQKPSPYGDVKAAHHPLAYQRGYAYTTSDKDTVYVKPFTGERGERFNYLQRLFGASGCSTNDGSAKNSLPFMKALYEEAQGLAQTQEEKRLLEYFLYAIEKLELGFEQAERRHLERVGK